MFVRRCLSTGERGPHSNRCQRGPNRYGACRPPRRTHLDTTRRHGVRAQPPRLAEGRGSASGFQELRMPSRSTLYSAGFIPAKGQVKVKRLRRHGGRHPTVRSQHMPRALLLQRERVTRGRYNMPRAPRWPPKAWDFRPFDLTKERSKRRCLPWRPEGTRQRLRAEQESRYKTTRPEHQASKAEQLPRAADLTTDDGADDDCSRYQQAATKQRTTTRRPQQASTKGRREATAPAKNQITNYK